jgi:hypothetical protein
MGFVRKITGVRDQIRAAQQNAKAQEDAVKQSAQQAEANAISSAKTAADQQAMLAERSVAEDKAAAAVAVPLEQADVSLSTETTGDTRRRRARFGRSYDTGVNI